MFKRLKRRREKKTDYAQRLKLLKSGKPRLVVRVSLKNVLMQIVQYEPRGDKILTSILTKDLKKFGWLGGCNLPAAYLTGLLAGYKILKKGINEAILDIGLQMSTKGNKIYAAVKGCKDAGLRIPIGENIIPSEERINGKSIENYARLLKENDPERYEKQFSSYLKNGLKPENISKHFEEVKNKIIDNFKAKG
ncbi:MAG: 50S ribosomal protein L18 [Candidatus Aenigmarchaeota archaeon]|nr:50S ribosomal protein L18 [Candidatus Aenigmarchaeota archaeon]